MLNIIKIKKKISIFFSKASINHFRKYTQGRQKNAIRIGINRTGCSGLAYYVDFMTQDLMDHTIIFKHGVKFLIHDLYSEYLNGLHVDYIVIHLGLSSIVFTNPNESARCGCGKSFTLDAGFK